MRDVHIGHPLPGNRFLRWLLAGYGCVWIAAAIAPDHRADWLLENLVVFAFGLLLIYPVREIARRTLHLHGAWAWAVPMLAILSLSSGYEIIESWTARIVDPELGTAFLGTQGDEWDAQKDMSLALVGGAITMALATAYQRRTGHEAWMLLR